VELGRIMEAEGLNARLLAKLEMRNPAGSVKVSGPAAVRVQKMKPC
jgi:cysteine synthase